MTVSFCTCKDKTCPFNPVNHNMGCTPCIAKNLKEKEIPTCFFRDAGRAGSGESWHYEDFARLVLGGEESEIKE